MAEQKLVSSARGALGASLVRNNKTIRQERGEVIYSDTERAYKRKVEDLEYDLEKAKRERENQLDLSPDNAQSLIVASNFDHKAFVEKDLMLSLDIRNREIAIEIAKERHLYLFIGEEVVEGVQVS